MNNNYLIPHSGIWPALLTPLHDDFSVNLQALAAHCRRLLEADCPGVTLFGTTGEGPSFSVAERIETLEGLTSAGIPAERILVHTGAAALPDAVTLTRHATALGAHGCLVMPPFFFKGVPEQGVVEYYRQLIRRVDDHRLRLVLYHLPQVSGVPLTISTVEQILSEFSDVVLGIKDSGCQRDASIALRKAVEPVQVWVGNEPDLPVMHKLGSTGAVSGVANILPELVQRLAGCKQSQDPQVDQERITSFLSIFERYPMLPAFKAMLSFAYQDPRWARMRPPLVALDDAQLLSLRALMNQLGFLPESS